MANLSDSISRPDLDANELTMILEGLVTTLNADGSANLAPMGPRVDRQMTSLQLRPFATSQTYANLRRHPEGILHVIDDVELLARSALGQLVDLPQMRPSTVVRGHEVVTACRWYAFRIEAWDDEGERANITCEIVAQQTQRDVFGWNRAQHGVLELAILATRLAWTDRAEWQRQVTHWAPIIEKCGGTIESRALTFLRQYVEEHGGW